MSLEQHLSVTKIALHEAIIRYEQQEEALEAARLLCANLEKGGVGHMALVRNFASKDNT